MEKASLNVTVLPLPAVVSAERSDYFMFGGTNPGLPPKNVIDSYPDIVLKSPIDQLMKQKLIDGDSVFIDPPDQKPDELHELDINTKGEMILTKYALDKEGQPVSREVRNVKANEVFFDEPVKLVQLETKKPLMPWEISNDDYTERNKNGISR